MYVYIYVHTYIYIYMYIYIYVYVRLYKSICVYIELYRYICGYIDVAIQERLRMAQNSGIGRIIYHHDLVTLSPSPVTKNSCFSQLVGG